MSDEHRIATYIIGMMVEINRRALEKATDEQRIADFEKDKLEMATMQAQIELGNQEAIDGCLEKYGAVVRFIMKDMERA